MERRKLICLDFDGVLHSYSSGWKGVRNIPDPPVHGALEWLCEALSRFDVAILSSRSHQWGGRRAMKGWLRGHLHKLALGLHEPYDADKITRYCDLCRFVGHDPFPADPHDEEYAAFGRSVVRRIQWPKHKPPAHVTIDDRAMRFKGDWSWYGLDDIDGFQPWNKRPSTDPGLEDK